MTGPRIVGDVSDLEPYGFGARSLMWWAAFLFCAMEGVAFLLAWGAFIFLMGHVDPWPPGPAPQLVWGGAFAVLSVMTMAPNVWVKRKAHAEDEPAVIRGVWLMTFLGVLLIALRIGELTGLGVRWDENAYGSIVWALLILHTAHLITDTLDTLVLAIACSRYGVDGGRHSDVDDNADYWTFVVVVYLPTFALLYFSPWVVS
jgi:cytochrome c oxidase subunit 3